MIDRPLGWSLHFNTSGKAIYTYGTPYNVRPTAAMYLLVSLHLNTYRCRNKNID